MAGGTWTEPNKIRPGLYINFMGENVLNISIGSRGTVALPLELNWGYDLIFLDYASDFIKILGYNLNRPEVLLIREAFKRAQRIIVYRVNGSGTAANTSVDDMVLMAKYTGTRGNDIKVAVSQNEDESYTIQVYVDGLMVEEQTVIHITDIISDWIVISGNLEVTAGANLANGTNSTATPADYSAAFEEFRNYKWNVIGYCGEDTDIKSDLFDYVKSLREDEGKYVQAVAADFMNDYEGVISVYNGVILSDGTELSNAQAVAWVAGATAGAAINQALTYSYYEDAISSSPILLHDEIVTALSSGNIVFSGIDSAKIESDINSLVTYTDTRTETFSKNRTVRTIDAIGNDLRWEFERSFIGRVDNDDDGHDLFKAHVIKYLTELQRINAIRAFDPENDVTVTAGSTGDSIFIIIAVQPIEATEKIYMTVKVR